MQVCWVRWKGCWKRSRVSGRKNLSGWLLTINSEADTNWFIRKSTKLDTQWVTDFLPIQGNQQISHSGNMPLNTSLTGIMPGRGLWESHSALLHGPGLAGRASCKPLPACFDRFLLFFLQTSMFYYVLLIVFSGGSCCKRKTLYFAGCFRELIWTWRHLLVDPCQALVSRGFCYLAQGEEELDVTFAFFFLQITGCVIGLHRFVFEKPDCDRCPVLFRTFFLFWHCCFDLPPREQHFFLEALKTNHSKPKKGLDELPGASPKRLRWCRSEGNLRFEPRGGCTKNRVKVFVSSLSIHFGNLVRNPT